MAAETSALISLTTHGGKFVAAGTCRVHYRARVSAGAYACELALFMRERIYGRPIIAAGRRRVVGVCFR